MQNASTPSLRYANNQPFSGKNTWSANISFGSTKDSQGTFEIIENRAIVSVDMISGELGNAIGTINNLVNLAKSNGATSLRIQGTIANDRLLPILVGRYGFTATNVPGYQEVLEIVFK